MSLATFSCLSYQTVCSLFQSEFNIVYCVRNVVAHGDAREGKWRGNWRMEWVASTLTRPWNVVYPALLTLMRTPRLPAVDWTDSPADLNGLVRLGERRNVVSARAIRFRTSSTIRCFLSIPSILSFPWGHPVAAYVVFPVFPSLLPPSPSPSMTYFRRHCLRKMWPV